MSDRIGFEKAGFSFVPIEEGADRNEFIEILCRPCRCNTADGMLGDFRLDDPTDRCACDMRASFVFSCSV